MSYTTITTIIAALLTVLVLVRLYTVLGRRTGQERQRVPFMGKKETNSKATAFASSPTVASPDSSSPTIDYPLSLAAQLKLVSESDSSFVEREFLAGAKNAFKIIVEATRNGTFDLITNLVSDEIKQSFTTAFGGKKIKKTKESIPAVAGGKTNFAKSKSSSKSSTPFLVEVTDIEITAAQVQEKRILITVKLYSIELGGNLTTAANLPKASLRGGDKPSKSKELVTMKKALVDRDSALPDSKVALASHEKLTGETLVDTWTFARMIGATDRGWLLVSTIDS